MLVFSVDPKGGYSHDVAVEGVFAGGEEEPAHNMWDIATADMMPELAGLEIVAVDGSGAVYLAWNDAGAWQQRTTWQDEAPLYAVAAGHLVADAPGIEVAVGGESKAVTVLSRCPARK